jgi:3-hydroxyisobutyrate dehydrogenase-like beta-hydroxyacid dehydrogenase
MLDAPLSGSQEGADQGTLSIMVGGDEVEFKRALEVLKTLGSSRPKGTDRKGTMLWSGPLRIWLVSGFLR